MAHEQAIAALKEACATGQWGIERVFTGECLATLRVGSGIAAAVEAKTGVTFEEAFDEPAQIEIAPAVGKFANHGYSLDKPDYTCVFIVAGPAVARQGDLGPLHMVDIAPTMAKVLGIPFPGCDGTAIAGVGASAQVVVGKHGS
ncbi:MAG: hypothetical protein DDT20_01473 [Firmicutes bacterium]|nr:hypothetical protein [Bacillota bacterium]